MLYSSISRQVYGRRPRRGFTLGAATIFCFLAGVLGCLLMIFTLKEVGLGILLLVMLCVMYGAVAGMGYFRNRRAERRLRR